MGRAIDAQTQSDNMVRKAIGGNFVNPPRNLKDALSKDMGCSRLLAIPARLRIFANGPALRGKDSVSIMATEWIVKRAFSVAVFNPPSFFR